MIRQATEDDLDTLYQFAQEMVAESIYPYATPSRTRIRNLIVYGRTAFFIDYRGDDPVGFIGITISPFFFSEVLHASDLGFFVRPAFRGGASALRLLRQAERWVKKMGCQTIFLGQSVGRKTDKVLNFYKRQGYELGGFNAMKRI